MVPAHNPAICKHWSGACSGKIVVVMFRGRRRKPTAEDPTAGATAQAPANTYVTALTMLSRRELSEKQLRDRLIRKGHEPEEIDDAVARLKTEHSLDDARVAQAIARTQTTVRRRGRLRVKRELEQAGIAGETARAALDATFGELDQGALLQAALGRRLRGERPITDDREFQRLYRYLVTQGFESDLALNALRARRARS